MTQHKEKPKKKRDKHGVLHHPREGFIPVLILENEEGKLKCTPEAEEAGFPKRNDKHEHDGTFEDDGWFDEALVEEVKTKG